MANREAVKVVLIETRYVKTDATSFKSVVQSLTGKDSSVAWIDKAGAFAGVSDGAAKRKRLSRISSVGSSVINSDCVVTKCEERSVLSKGLSFEDLDRLLLEFPPMEDLQYWLSDDYTNIATDYI